MSECVKLLRNGKVAADINNCDLVLLTQTEVVELVEAAQFNLSLFEFDSGMYDFILAQTLITFITGHVLGRVLKTFGKV